MKKTVLFLVVLLTSTAGVLAYKNLYRPFSLTKEFMESSDYQSQIQQFKSTEIPPSSVVLLGNSIVRQYKSELKTPIIKLAINGDILDGLTWREEVLRGKKTSHLIISMGVNDIIHGYGYELEKLSSFIDAFRKSNPTTEIAIFSIGPENLERGMFTSPERIQQEIVEANREIQDYCTAERITYLNSYELLGDNGKLISEFSTDGLHLNDKGYEIWDKLISDFMTSTP